MSKSLKEHHETHFHGIRSVKADTVMVRTIPYLDIAASCFNESYSTAWGQALHSKRDRNNQSMKTSWEFEAKSNITETM